MKSISTSANHSLAGAQMSHDPNTYDRPPDTFITSNGKINPSNNLPTQKNLSSTNGDKSICSTDNARHSSPQTPKETYKSVVEKRLMIQLLKNPPRQLSTF